MGTRSRSGHETGSASAPGWVGAVVALVMLPAAVGLFVGIDALRAEPADTTRAAVGFGAFISGAVIAFVVTKLGGRRRPLNVAQLLTAQVPEIRAGVVHIVAIAREPGLRTKVALRSSEPTVDPISAVLGPEGERIRLVVEAAKGEPFDLVPWDEDAPRFVCAALAPISIAKIVVDEQRREMDLVIERAEDPVLGLHLRLAGELTGWRLNRVP